jgi:hypothetical protein
MMLVTGAFDVAVFLAPSAAWTLMIFIVPAATSNIYLAPVLAQTQSLVGLRMRGVASALMLLILNMIGLGLGPLAVGYVSDLLAPRFADESMRYSLLIICAVLLPWAAWHYYLAGKSIDADLERAAEND